MGIAPNKSGQVGQEAGQALTIAARFASQDKTRPILTAVLWRGGEEQDTIVGTDTYRLFLRNVEREDAGIKPEPGEDWLIPAEAVCKVTSTQAVRRHPEVALRCPCPVKEAGEKKGTVVYEFDAEADDSPHHIGVQARDHDHRSKVRLTVAHTVEGQFPNYERVIPDLDDPTNPVTWEGEVQAEKLSAVLPHLYNVEECHRIETQFGDANLTLRAVQINGYDLEARAEVTAEVALHNKPKVARFNGQFLAEFADLASEQGGYTHLRWRYRGPLSPLMIDGPTGLYLLMPMQEP